jgi:hypothetical protein
VTSHQFDAWDDHNPALDGYRGPRDDAAAAVNTLRDVLVLTNASATLPAADIVFRVRRVTMAALERLQGPATAGQHASRDLVDLAELVQLAAVVGEEPPF